MGLTLGRALRLNQVELRPRLADDLHVAFAAALRFDLVLHARLVVEKKERLAASKLDLGNLPTRHDDLKSLLEELAVPRVELIDLCRRAHDSVALAQGLDFVDDLLIGRALRLR